jgi:hypothetical protein
MVKRTLGVLLIVSALFASSSPAAEPPKMSASLRKAVAADPFAVQVAWVFFTDKGQDAQGTSQESVVSSRARARRTARGRATDPAEDRPLARDYVDGVAQRTLRLRHESRWFNAVSVEATPSQLEELSALPYVARIDLVRRLAGPRR